MRPLLRRFSAVVLPLLLATGAVGTSGAEASPAVVEFRLKHGDDPRWSAPEFDDHDWPVVARADGRPSPGGVDFVPAHSGVFWIRYRIERSTHKGWGSNVPSYCFPADEPDAPINSVFIPGTFCYEFFWDGRLIGRSGVVGASRETEVPGPIDNLMLIPDNLLGPGSHVIAIRASTYHYNFPASRFRISATMGNYAARLNYEARQAIVPLIGAAGGLLVTAVCAVLFWFVDRRRPLVICGLLGFAVALFFTLIAWRWLHQDPFTWLYPRYQLMLVTMAVIGALMLWLLIEQFAVPHWQWWTAGFLVIVAVVLNGTAYHQMRMMWLGRALLGYALLPVAWAVWKKRPGAQVALIGVLIGLGSVQQAADLRAVLSPSFFLFFGALVVILLSALGWQIRADREHARAAQLAAARLEAELLKKNIQPHFLLNTLAVLTEIVEQDPRSAVKLIDDLADEFRTVARVSAEKLIPLEQELELCRAHLRVMSVRTGRTWSLETSGMDAGALVPPAVFLTLIENGFAHQRVPGDAAAAFRLTIERTAEGARRCVFLSPGEVQENLTRTTGGTGLRYVRARFDESFSGKWTLVDGPVAGGWHTVIEIKQAAEGGRA